MTPCSCRCPSGRDPARWDARRCADPATHATAGRRWGRFHHPRRQRRSGPAVAWRWSVRCPSRPGLRCPVRPRRWIAAVAGRFGGRPSHTSDGGGAAHKTTAKGVGRARYVPVRRRSKPRVRDWLCKPICKLDAAGQAETGGDVADPTQLPAVGSPRSAWTRETARDSRDGRRSAHNPEVGGSNPPPLLVSAGQGPFTTRKRVFCVSGV